MSLVLASSCCVNVSHEPGKGGIISFAPLDISRSSIENPLSAMISSPLFNEFKNPDFLTISLSEMEPPKASEIYTIVPLGAIPTRNL